MPFTAKLKSWLLQPSSAKLNCLKLQSVDYNLLLQQAMSMALSVSIMAIAVPFTTTTSYAASCKLPKSYYKYVSCTADSRYFLAVKDMGAPVALIDKNGKRVIDLSAYQKAAGDKLRSGLLPIQRNNKVGYLNMQGREVVPAMYDILANGGDNQGWARAVSEDRIVVKKDGRFGVINTMNQVIVPFSSEFTNMNDYQGGRIKVTSRTQGSLLLDKQGNVIKTPPPAPSQTEKKDTSSAAPIEPPVKLPFTTLYPSQKNGRWGFVDDKEVLMITYSFDEVMPFSEGLAGVRIDNNWGFVNLGGELVIPFRYEDAGVDKSDHYKGVKPFIFMNGKAWVSTLKNGDKICITTTGINVDCD